MGSFKAVVVLALVLLAAVSAVAGEFPPVGQPAPHFQLRNEDAKSIGLEEFRGKWLVIPVYAQPLSPEDSRYLKNYAKDFASFEALGATIVTIGYGDPDAARYMRKSDKLPFTVLSDPWAETLKTYNSAMVVGRGEAGVRNVFIIDPEGILRKVLKETKPGTSATQALAALKELQAAAAAGGAAAK
jgi:peroxiredoxin Q/BCP